MDMKKAIITCTIGLLGLVSCNNTTNTNIKKFEIGKTYYIISGVVEIHKGIIISHKDNFIEVEDSRREKIFFINTNVINAYREIKKEEKNE